MNDMARIVRDGDRQTIELPAGFGFDVEEVRVRREGDYIVLGPSEDDGWGGYTLAEIRALVAEGEDESGDAKWDAQEIIRAGYERLEAEKRG